MRRRSFLLGALLAPVAAALRLGGAQLKFPMPNGDAIPLDMTEYQDRIAIRRSTVSWQPMKWYDVGDVIEIEGKAYEITKTETRQTKLGPSTVYVGDAYLRELREELAPKADLRYALNRFDTFRFEYPFEVKS